MANIQHSNGWSYRAGISYASDSNQQTKTETYSEFYPYVGMMKTYSHNEDTLGIFNLSVGYHDSDSDPSPFDSAQSRSVLNNFDIIASYGIQYIYNNFIISTYSATYKIYDESGTLHEVNGREDLIHSLNVTVDYPVNEYLNVGFLVVIQKEILKIQDHSLMTSLKGRLDYHSVLTLPFKYCILNF